MARLRAVGPQFTIAMQASLEATQKLLVATAKREHGKVMAADPRPASYRRYVDGVQGAREEAVKPSGVIFYEYPRLDIVAQFAMETLFDLSPVLTGAYRLAHSLFLDGTLVRNLKDWHPGGEVVITNYEPYARKIEIGSMTMRLPGSAHVYDQAEQTVRARYGNLARIDFTYRGVVGGGLAKGRDDSKAALRYPALLIRER